MRADALPFVPHGQSDNAEHESQSRAPDHLGVADEGVVNLLTSLYRLCTPWHSRCVKTVMPANPLKKHRCPAWLYFRVCLSYRDGEELLFARGIIVTYESIRQWGRKFGQQYANH
jgi:hypothetical protein